MSLFRKPEPAAEEKPRGGGGALLRGALHNYNRNPAAIVSVQSDVNCATGVLDAFERGADNLTAEQLSALADRFFNADYDAERDLLVSRSLPATTVGATVPVFDLEVETYPPRWRPGPPPLFPRSPDAESKPAQLSRPGWA